MGALVPTPFTDLGLIWQETVDSQFMLNCQISYESIYCHLPWMKKSAIFGQCLHLGDSCAQPHYWWGPNMVCWSRPIVYAYVQNFVSIGLFCCTWTAENPKFCHFSTSAFCGVAIWWHTENVQCKCSTANLPLSNIIKIVSVFQCLQGKLCAQTPSFKSMTDRLTNKKLCFWLP